MQKTGEVQLRIYFKYILMSNWKTQLESIGDHAKQTYDSFDKRNASRPLDFPSPVSSKSTEMLEHDLHFISFLIFSIS